MFQLLYDPLAEIRKCKRQQFGRILLYLLTAALFETVGLLFFAWRYIPEQLTPNLVVNGILLVLFGIIVCHLICAFFFALAMHVLDGKGGYYEGLAAIVLSSVAPAVMTFFGGALSFAPLGIFVALFLITFGYVLGLATLFRAGKELFELDYAGVAIGFLVTVIPLGVAVCIARLLAGM